jgi:hypothetical protein
VKGAAIYARYFMSCSLYREQVIVVFRVKVDVKWMEVFLARFLLSFSATRLHFPNQKNGRYRVDSAVRLINIIEFCSKLRLYWASLVIYFCLT